ncbi:MAG: phosphate ABC transporter permease family protein, partial [Paracoccaceae bacterium]|nr:phosphate ABC transporter permease family protein [Paracoccaceae bacterium]
MPLSWTILALAILPVIGFVLGRNRAISSAGGDTRNLHSLPSYYGWSVALFTALPAILVMCVWLIVQPSVIANAVSGLLPEATPGDANAQTLVMTDVRRLAAAIEAGRSVGILSGSETAQEVQGKLSDLGVVLGAQVTPEILAAATAWGLMAERGGGLMSAVVLALALVGFWFSYRRITRDFRARNSIEAAIRAGLIACSVIAIATTAGIVLSMLFETGQFFRQYAWTEFFFGKNWQPNFRGNSDLGILPLLWGTLYISFIALAVAVP